ncbi:MAG: GDSL-type esterase/lipase family protein, partial [Candidatus Erginobacter occultus]|nr:GDSL-type esterase/lipase family protein [Candidatus Erginobacter occultus]
MEFDRWLGWVPKPGRYGRHVITPDRFRNNQPPNLSPTGKKVLICGDSFAYGCGALDEETWPYYLAAATGWRVTNAGVSGYGLDQIVLRLEQVIPHIRPELVIISVIANDVDRCELSKRTRYKPYFTIVDDKPVLRNQPVPSPIESPGLHRWYESSLIIRHLTGVFNQGVREVP